jgi:hypothetical protein
LKNSRLKAVAAVRESLCYVDSASIISVTVIGVDDLSVEKKYHSIDCIAAGCDLCLRCPA